MIKVEGAICCAAVGAPVSIPFKHGTADVSGDGLASRPICPPVNDRSVNTASHKCQPFQLQKTLTNLLPSESRAPKQARNLLRMILDWATGGINEIDQYRQSPLFLEAEFGGLHNELSGSGDTKGGLS